MIDMEIRYQVDLKIRGKKLNEIQCTLEKMCAKISIDEDIISYNVIK